MKATEVGEITVVSEINEKEVFITINNIFVVPDLDSNLLLIS